MDLKSLNEEILKTLRNYNSIYDNELISEASKIKILTDKEGLSVEQATFLDEKCGPLAVWMFNKFKDVSNKNHLSLYTKPYQGDELINKINSRNLIISSSYDIQSIMDWIRVGLNGNMNQYKDLTWKELFQKSKEWHDSLQIGQGKINYVEPHTHDIILDFRNKNGEGFYWVDLNTNNSSEECNRMGHCGRTGNRNTIVSLREVKRLPGEKYTLNKSHLTAAIGNDNVLYQLKGPKNSKPKEEYHDYILPLFYIKDENNNYLIQEFGSEYASQQDFKITDLPNDVIIYLYRSRPDLFSSRRLQRKLMDMGIIDKPEINYKVRVEINPDDLDRYVSGDWVIRQWKTKEGHSRKVTMFETILAGETSDLWDNYNADWRSGINYYSDKKNEEKINELIKKLATKDNPDFDEEEFNAMNLEDKIKEYDDNHDLTSAISGAINNAEQDSYSNMLYDTLKEAVEELGEVIKFDDEGIVIIVNMEKYLNDIDDVWYDDYMERCDDDLGCVFSEMIGEVIDKPEFSIDDRWYPDIDKSSYNEILSDRLGEVDYEISK
jgi:hypothetical protein